MQKLIYIIRHGETELNRRRIVQGRGVDASLNETGRAQGRAFYDYYGAVDFEVVLTSTLRRTHETVAPFLEKGVAWEQHPEIDEISWGDSEGKPGTPESIAAYRAMVKAWQAGDFDHRLPNAESAREMGERVQRFVDALRERPERAVLVCAHGRLMRALICVLEGCSLTEMENIHHANTGLYLVRQHETGFRIELRNDTRHLESITANE